MLVVRHNSVPVGGAYGFFPVCATALVVAAVWILFAFFGQVTLSSNGVQHFIATLIGFALVPIIWKFDRIVWFFGRTTSEKAASELLAKFDSADLVESDVNITGTATDILKLMMLKKDFFEPIVFRCAIRLGSLSWQDTSIILLVVIQIPLMVTASYGRPSIGLVFAFVFVTACFVIARRDLFAPKYIRVIPGQIDLLRSFWFTEILRTEKSVRLSESTIAIDLTMEEGFVRIYQDDVEVAKFSRSDVYVPLEFAGSILMAHLHKGKPPSIPSNQLLG